MNDVTRSTLENQAVECLRRMERTLIQIRRVNNELDRLRDAQRAEIKKVEEYLDMIEKADPRFNREKWLNHAKRELV